MNYLPPEWAPQSGVMITWPHQHSIWQTYLREADKCFAEIAAHITQHEYLLVTHYDQAHKQHITQLLNAAGAQLDKIRFFEAKSNDVWVRDHGPLTVINNHHPILMDLEFNAWGGKYNYSDDNVITRTLHEHGAFAKTPIEHINFVLEGGGIETDGKGTMLTTESVLLAETRNQTSKAEIENFFKKWFGIERMLWLKHGYLAGDDTDGHVDTLARFVDAHTICYVGCQDKTDEHYAALQTMRQELESFRNYEGQAYKLVELPMPAAQYSENGERLPATYANFLIINDAVLMPIYGDAKNDAVAEKILQSCFTDRKVIPINCRVLINLYGSLHCATMQLPTGVLL